MRPMLDTTSDRFTYKATLFTLHKIGVTSIGEWTTRNLKTDHYNEISQAYTVRANPLFVKRFNTTSLNRQCCKNSLCLFLVMYLCNLTIPCKKRKTLTIQTVDHSFQIYKKVYDCWHR